MKWKCFLLFWLFFSASLLAHAQQSMNPCSGKNGIASVPLKILEELRATTRMPNSHEGSRKALEIARRPKSGLKPSFVLTDTEDRILDLVIVVESAPGCKVLVNTFNFERR
jgi:hypothetical protein